MRGRGGICRFGVGAVFAAGEVGRDVGFEQAVLRRVAEMRFAAIYYNFFSF